MADLATVVPDSSTALSVEGVSVRFGGLLALDGVDLELTAGHIHGLIGPNGAGKTTLFNVITGLQRPTHGTVHMGSHDITRSRPHARSMLGLGRTFQRLELFGTLTARENVQMAAEVQRRKNTSGRNPSQEAEFQLEQVGILHVADQPTDSLPTGLARLVELARALATSPSVLLLDEPSSGLDADESHALGQVLQRVASEGTSVLLVEHDMTLVMGICHSVVVLDHGQVISQGDPVSVRADAKVQEAYLGSEASTSDPINRAQPTVPATPRDVATGAARALALSVDGVRAGYGRIEVLHGITLEVPKCSALALLGPNGAGKSTLLKVISGQLAPTAGRVDIGGRNVKKNFLRIFGPVGCVHDSRRAIDISKSLRVGELVDVHVQAARPESE